MELLTVLLVTVISTFLPPPSLTLSLLSRDSVTYEFVPLENTPWPPLRTHTHTVQIESPPLLPVLLLRSSSLPFPYDSLECDAASLPDLLCVEARWIEFRRSGAGVANPSPTEGPLALTTASHTQPDSPPTSPSPHSPSPPSTQFAVARAIDSLRMCCGRGSIDLVFMRENTD